MQKLWFSFGFSMFFITLQKCIRRRLPFGCPTPLIDANLEAQSLPRTATWTSKALPDVQVGGPKPFPDPNMEAKSVPRRQLGGPKAVQDTILEVQRPSKTPFWRPNALQHVNFEAPGAPWRSSWQPKLSSEEQNFEELNLR